MKQCYSVVCVVRAANHHVGLCCLVLLALLASGCIFVPHTDSQQPYAENCQMRTRHLSLQAVAVNGSLNCHSNESDAAACLAMVAVIPAGSFLVSGSVVIVSNSLHWLEYQGSCSEGFMYRQLQFFKQQLDSGTEVSVAGE